MIGESLYSYSENTMKSADKIVLDGLFQKLAQARRSTEKRSIVEMEINRIKWRINLVSWGKYFPFHAKHVENNKYWVSVQEPLLLNA